MKSAITPDIVGNSAARFEFARVERATSELAITRWLCTMPLLAAGKWRARGT